MKYIINKNKKKYKLEKKLSLKNGFDFNKSINITIYNEDMIKNIINSKIKSRLNKISVLYMLYSNDEDDDSTGRLVQIKIEELRSILLGDFKNFISDSKRQAIEKDLSKISDKIKINSKTKSRWQEMTLIIHFFFYTYFGESNWLYI